MCTRRIILFSIIGYVLQSTCMLYKYLLSIFDIYHIHIYSKDFIISKLTPKVLVSNNTSSFTKIAIWYIDATFSFSTKEMGVDGTWYSQSVGDDVSGRELSCATNSRI